MSGVGGAREFSMAVSQNASEEELRLLILRNTHMIGRRPNTWRIVGVDERVTDEDSYYNEEDDLSADENQYDDDYNGDDSELEQDESVGSSEDNDIYEDDEDEDDDENEDDDEDDDEDGMNDEDDEDGMNDEEFDNYEFDFSDVDSSVFEEDNNNQGGEDVSTYDNDLIRRKPLNICAIFDRADVARILLEEYNAMIPQTAIKICIHLGHRKTLSVLLDYVNHNALVLTVNCIIRANQLELLKEILEKGLLTTRFIAEEGILRALYLDTSGMPKETNNALQLAQWLEEHGLLSSRVIEMFLDAEADFNDKATLKFLAAHVGALDLHRPNHFLNHNHHHSSYKQWLQCFGAIMDMEFLQIYLNRLYPLHLPCDDPKNWVSFMMDRKYLMLAVFNRLNGLNRESESESNLRVTEYLWEHFVEPNPWLLCLYEIAPSGFARDNDRNLTIIDNLVLCGNIRTLRRALCVLQRLEDGDVKFPLPMESSDPSCRKYVKPYDGDELRLQKIIVVDPAYLLRRIRAHVIVSLMLKLFVLTDLDGLIASCGATVEFIMDNFDNLELGMDRLGSLIHNNSFPLVEYGLHRLYGKEVCQPLSNRTTAFTLPPVFFWKFSANSFESKVFKVVMERCDPNLFVAVFLFMLRENKTMNDQTLLKLLRASFTQAVDLNSVVMMDLIARLAYLFLEYAMKGTMKAGYGLRRDLREQVDLWTREYPIIYFQAHLNSCRFDISVMNFLLNTLHPLEREQARFKAASSVDSKAEAGSVSHVNPHQQLEIQDESRAESKSTSKEVKVPNKLRSMMKMVRKSRRCKKKTTMKGQSGVSYWRALSTGVKEIYDILRLVENTNEHVFSLGHDWYCCGKDDVDDADSDGNEDSENNSDGRRQNINEYLLDILEHSLDSNMVMPYRAPERDRRAAYLEVFLKKCIELEKEQEHQEHIIGSQRELHHHIAPTSVIRSIIDPYVLAAVVQDGDPRILEILHRYHLLYPRQACPSRLFDSSNRFYSQFSFEQEVTGAFPEEWNEYRKIWPLMESIFNNNALPVLQMVVEEAMDAGGPRAVHHLLRAKDTVLTGVLDGTKICKLRGFHAMDEYITQKLQANLLLYTGR